MAGTATEPSRHLVLVHTAGWQDVANFQEIKNHVEEMAPDIRVFIASNDIRSSFTRKKSAALPSLIFSPLKLWHFQPDRGKIYQGQPMSKLTEMRRLTEAGMPVPPFEEIGPGTKLAAETWGSYTIVKPSYELASWGQGVELLRTEEVRYREPSDYPAKHPGRQAPMIAQRFIDCGKPMSCRVLTLFGAPLFTYCRESTKPLALDDRAVFEQSDFLPSPPDMVRYATHDPAILDLAAAAYRAMPDVALQACDIIREKTGKLYLLEVNPGGGTWMFSSPNAPSYRTHLGTDDLTAEFDAFRTCARVLIERTRAEAT